MDTEPETTPTETELEQLVASIDRQIVEAFGPSPMPDLSQIEPEQAAGQELYVAFDVPEFILGLPILSIDEIGRPPQLTYLPHVPDWVIGAANFRGEIIAVVDLAAHLGLGPASRSSRAHSLVVHSADGRLMCGLLIQRVREVVRLDLTKLEAAEPGPESSQIPYLRGVYRNDEAELMILDPEQLLLGLSQASQSEGDQ